MEEGDVDDCCDELPPPPDLNSRHQDDAINNRLLVSPRPAPRKTQASIHNYEVVQDVHTPRSNRSVDSGLPHDDVTPRSDSLSTESSSSPPDRHQQQHQLPSSNNREHRKSTSMDDINVRSPQHQQRQPQQSQQPQQQQQQQWKSYSLQRRVATVPIVEEGAEEGSLLIRTNTNITSLPQIQQHQQHSPQAKQVEEDLYGRCMNMKLTSFEGTPSGNNIEVQLRDPRIIDLGNPASPSEHQQQQPELQPRIPSQQFNTLPVQHGNDFVERGPSVAPAVQFVHNTLPTRINQQQQQQQHPQSARNSFVGSNGGPTGRHFKPFDHRKMNPMAEISENPVFGVISEHSTIVLPENLYMVQQQEQNPSVEAIYASTRGNPIVQKNSQLPHMPSELRHTNYSSSSATSTNTHPHHPQQQKIVNLQVLDHRDSANFSLTSSDSG